MHFTFSFSLCNTEFDRHRKTVNISWDKQLSVNVIIYPSKVGELKATLIEIIAGNI